MPPEAVRALLSAAGSNPQALQDFLRTSGANVMSSGTTPVASTSYGSSASGLPATSSALLPYHHQPLYNPTPSPLDFSFSSSLAPATTALTTAAAAMPSPISFESALAENNDVLSSVLSEKADIDQRTAALENQITKLLDNLPDDAREQVENEAANGESSNWAGIDWDNYTNDDGGVDFDKMLAQLSEICGSGFRVSARTMIGWRRARTDGRISCSEQQRCSDRLLRAPLEQCARPVPHFDRRVFRSDAFGRPDRPVAVQPRPRIDRRSAGVRSDLSSWHGPRFAREFSQQSGVNHIRQKAFSQHGQPQSETQERRDGLRDDGGRVTGGDDAGRGEHGHEAEHAQEALLTRVRQPFIRF